MWKIEKTEDRDSVVLAVSGRIEGKHLTELREVLTAEHGNRNFVLDMSGVKLVDQESIEFLSYFEACGTQLRNCPSYIREWIERDRQAVGDFQA